MGAMRIWLLAVALLAAATASAQYKVVAPDGRVTYTDRPGDAPAGSRISRVGHEGAAEPSTAPSTLASLPFELRQVAERFPVTLYAAADCAPCDRGRQLLQQRGIPYLERRVQTEEDLAALERLAGARTLPVLAVGGQISRGWLESEWVGNLDLAGYPARSQLPRGWQPPPVTPLAARPEPAAGGGPAMPAVPTPAQPAEAPAPRP
jgi:glutaredoxin